MVREHSKVGNIDKEITERHYRDSNEQRAGEGPMGGEGVGNETKHNRIINLLLNVLSLLDCIVHSIPAKHKMCISVFYTNGISCYHPSKAKVTPYIARAIDDGEGVWPS